MSNITTVTLTSGLGTAGTGTISTLDNLIAAAGSANTNVQTVQGIASMTPILATATLNAETTKVIGVTRAADGAGNLLTSTANALDINIKSGGNPNAPQALAQSSSVALSTGSAAVSMAVNPVITASSTYTAGNEVGGLMTFTGIGRDPNSSGVVQDVTILSKTVQTGEFDLYIFNSNPTASTWADKTAPSITGADKLALIGVVKMTKNYSGLGTHTMYKPDETTFAPIPFSGANLYGILVTPGVPSAQFGTTSDLSVILGVI